MSYMGASPLQGSRDMLIHNARAITPAGTLEDAWVWVSEGRIAGIGQGHNLGDRSKTGSAREPESICSGSRPPAPQHIDSPTATKQSWSSLPAGDCRYIDAGGLFLSPGFVDIHVHGGGGHDFMDATPGAFLGAAREHAKHGTTAMVPTTVAAGASDIGTALATLGAARGAIRQMEAASPGSSGAPQLLGLHVEGPYLAMEQRGAQDPRYIRNPDPSEYLPLLDLSSSCPGGAGILRWTVAPELPGALEFGRALASRGIQANIGHSNATCEEALQAVATAGYRHVTHLYSCMSTVTRVLGFRHAGVLEAAYLADNLTVELIADGCHLPSSLLRLAYKLKGPGRIALVTDAMRAAGLPEGESTLGSLMDGQRVVVEDGVAKLPDRSAFAGSVATADRLVRTMVELGGVPLGDAIRMMCQTPCEIAGVQDRKGTIEVGKDADLVLFDSGVDVKMTVVRGAVVHTSPKGSSRLGG